MKKVEAIFCCCFECEVEQSLDFILRALQGHRRCVDSTIAYLSPRHCIQERKETHGTGQGSLLLANCSSTPEVSGFLSQPDPNYWLRGEALHCFGTHTISKTDTDLQLGTLGPATFNSKGNYLQGHRAKACGKASLQGVL